MDRLLLEGTERLRSVLYHSRKQDLEVEMKDASLYRHFSVPPQTYLALMKADDKDAFYDKHIKEVFIYRKVTS